MVKVRCNTANDVDVHAQHGHSGRWPPLELLYARISSEIILPERVRESNVGIDISSQSDGSIRLRSQSDQLPSSCAMLRLKVAPMPAQDKESEQRKQFVLIVLLGGVHTTCRVVGEISPCVA